MGWFNWLFSKTEVKNNFAVPEYDPEFHYKDKVIVIGGFYKGMVGVVLDQRIYGIRNTYHVYFGENKSKYIKNTDLQLIEDKKE